MSMFVPYSREKVLSAQNALLDNLASTAEVTNTYTVRSGKDGVELGYLPFGHWYQAGRGHVSVRIGTTPYGAIEVLRKVAAHDPELGDNGNVPGETTKASTADWCNKVRINVTGTIARFWVDWEEHIIPFHSPGIVLTGPVNVEHSYIDPDKSMYGDEGVQWSAQASLAPMLLELPAGYRWEVWRRRKSKHESNRQITTSADMARQHYGHFVLYDRLNWGERSLGLIKPGEYRFAVFNQATGARSYLSRDTVQVRGYMHLVYIR